MPLATNSLKESLESRVFKTKFPDSHVVISICQVTQSSRWEAVMIWQPHPWSLSVTWGSGGATCLPSSRVAAWDTIPGFLLPAGCALVWLHYQVPHSSGGLRPPTFCQVPHVGINLVPWVQAAASLFHSGLFHSPLFPFLLKLVPARVITNLRPFQQVQTLASLKPLPSFTASSVCQSCSD